MKKRGWVSSPAGAGGIVPARRAGASRAPRPASVSLAIAGAKRQCGECSACCVVMGIMPGPALEFGKPPYAPCTHQCSAPGGSCGLHGRHDKPIECSNFSCLWKFGGVDPSHAVPIARLRPDHLGVFLVPNNAIGLPAFNAFEVEPGSAERLDARHYLRAVALFAVVVLVRQDGTRRVYGPPQFRPAIIELLKTIKTAADAAARDCGKDENP